MRAETPYHSWRHILHGLSLLFDYRDRIPDFDAALIAWLNHDRIYDAQRTDNEDLSAGLARQMCEDLGQVTLADLAVELVLDTKHDRTPATETGRWIVGVDLAILGESPERYDEYETNIRREYAHVGDIMYRPRPRPGSARISRKGQNLRCARIERALRNAGKRQPQSGVECFVGALNRFVYKLKGPQDDPP